MRPRPRCGCCCIVPPHLLKDLSESGRLKPSDPSLFAATFAQTAALASNRPSQFLSSPPPRVIIPDADLQASPTHLFDCANQPRLPGDAIASLEAGGPGGAAIAKTTADVLRFYREVLGRDSFDRKGSPVVSSLNYGENFLNAFWSGQEMVYGNGDQDVFVDFWRAPDVICHEITHGVTEKDSGLAYVGEAGALNESISDVFAAVFNQWLGGLPASEPSGWRLGAGILGPRAKASYSCLRDLMNPPAQYCLAHQPNIYPHLDLGGDVHLNSGIPNRAFALFANAVGGNAYDTPIKVWYAVCTSPELKPAATMADFAALTIRVAAAWPGPGDKAALGAAVRNAWALVQVPMPVGGAGPG